MARQLDEEYNFNMGYLMCDIPDNMVEVVDKIKMTFRKHTLVEDQERRTVKYRLLGRCNQPKIKIETRKKVTQMKVRRMSKEGTESVTSLDSGTWIPEGEGFGYPAKGSLIEFTCIQVGKKSRKKTILMMKVMVMQPLMTMSALMSQCKGKRHQFPTK